MTTTHDAEALEQHGIAATGNVVHNPTTRIKSEFPFKYLIYHLGPRRLDELLEFGQVTPDFSDHQVLQCGIEGAGTQQYIQCRVCIRNHLVGPGVACRGLGGWFGRGFQGKAPQAGRVGLGSAGDLACKCLQFMDGGVVENGGLTQHASAQRTQCGNRSPRNLGQ